jgi:hypothetical protein
MDVPPARTQCPGLRLYLCICIQMTPRLQTFRRPLGAGDIVRDTRILQLIPEPILNL